MHRKFNLKSQLELDKFNPSDVISLMDIYLNEWMHRDELLWTQAFKYFYATLVVLFLPNIASFLRIDLPNIPVVLFPIIALVLSAVFLYVTIGYCKRLEASGMTYQKIINYLPGELQRVPLECPQIKYGKFFRRRMSAVLCSLMFFGLLLLSVGMLCYHLKS